jgi:hypothetical protein
MTALQTFGGNSFALQAALGAYADEAYTNARKLSSTGIVGPNPDINTDTETFIGQVRWFKPLNPTINIASLTDSAKGTGTNYSSDFSTYVKSVRTHGATQINLASVVTRQDGLAKIGRDFAETRGGDEHNAVLATLKGVATAEALHGAGSAGGGAGLGGQTFDNDPTDKKFGFYVDLGANKLIADASVTEQGAQRAQGFLNALGMAWKDYEPEYAYLVTSPEILASLRSANLVDQVQITDGNIMFETIFNGKFRLIQTRASQGFSVAQLAKLNLGAGADIIGTKTSFIVLPGAIAMEPLSIPTPTEIFRDGGAYNGGGATDIWYRWGYVAHPAGYNWNGRTTVFPSDAEFQQVVTPSLNGGDPIDLIDSALVAGATIDGAVGVWQRKATSALTLGILPVFHS